MTYTVLIEAGHSAEYLDHCTLFDLDLFARKYCEHLKQRGPRL